jgi:hypothetical protein
MIARLRRWWPAIVCALAIGFQFRAPLLGRVYFFEDVAAYFQPLYHAAARSMRLGDLPSWELGAWSGQPLLGDPQIGILYPPNWLWLWVTPLRMYAWLQLAHAAWGALGMAMLARARGRSREAQAVAALAVGLGAFVVLETRHAMFVATTAWLPWILWGVERYARERRLEQLVAIAASTAMAILAGGWSMLVFGGAVVGVYAIARIATQQIPQTVAQHDSQTVAQHDSQTVAQHDSQAVAQPDSKTADKQIGGVWPSLRPRALLAGAVIGAGLIGVALSAAQLLPALAHARLSPRALGLEYSAAASYAWPSWRYLLTLVVPTLYGDDARGTWVGAPDQWELCGYAIGAVATLLLPFALWPRERRRERLALLSLCVFAIFVARGEGGGLHPLLFRLPVFGSLRCPARALYVWTLVAPLLAADGLDALADRLRPPRLRAWLPRAVVLALAAELLITWRAENPSVRLDETRARPAAADFLTSHGRPGRMVTDVHLGQRFHNAGLAWNFESAVGYSSLPIWRYLHLLWIANHGRTYPHARIADDLTAQGLWRFSSPIVDLLSVNWVVAPRDRPPDAPGFERVFAGDDGVDLWRNRHAYPRAFVVYRTQVVANEQAAAEAMASPDFHPSRVVVVEQPVAGVADATDRESPPMPDELHALTRTGPFDVAVEVEARAPGVVVLGEPWYPGWRATVDGKPVELLRVDYALRGVRVDAGVHVVAMTFEDQPLFYGAAISFTALALLVGLTWLARAERKRRRRAASA